MITTCAQGVQNLYFHYISALAWLNAPCSAERAVNEKLAETPEVYLLALVQLARTEPNEVVSPSRPHNANAIHARLVVDALVLSRSPSPPSLSGASILTLNPPIRAHNAL
jgi:hypothetical protein